MSPSQYFDRSPAVASRPGRVMLSLPDGTVTLDTDRGVFSYGAIDAGTRLLLLEAPALPVGGTFCDLGCGYGPIAVTMARRSPAATVWAIDTNTRALALCAANAATNGCINLRAVEPDDVPTGVRFNVLWSNPPIRIGKSALHALLDGWLGRLSDDGVAVLVVQKHLGADSLAAWLGERGWLAARLVSRQGYRLLRVERAR